ncbi:MAG: polyprenyl synthetase family protein [Candidatus Promineofilum sp.]|nr:polyprenyl synthetase family protein [Promineifilum sp.]
MDLTLTREGLEAVEDALIAAIDSEVELLNDASRHILMSGGKHLRPHIAMLSYLAVGGEDLLEAVPMAAAIEMVHTATLVHDDINDHSLLRRGRPSVHARWGRTFALLTGDYMFAKVYELMAPYGPTYNVIMADACCRLVEGRDAASRGRQGGGDRPRDLQAHRQPEDGQPVRGLGPHGCAHRRRQPPRGGRPGRIRLQPGHRLPGGGRYPRRCRRPHSAGQAGRHRSQPGARRVRGSGRAGYPDAATDGRSRGRGRGPRCRR